MEAFGDRPSAQAEGPREPELARPLDRVLAKPTNYGQVAETILISVSFM
jgi:hypothetical protein